MSSQPTSLYVEERRPEHGTFEACMWFVLLFVAFWLVSVLPARAQAEPDLQALRLALSSYDIEHGGALSVLRDLQTLSTRKSGAAANEVRFLRAAVASDLLILARISDRPELTAGVAKALSVKPEALFDHVVSELGQVARTHFRQPALEALETLVRLHEDPAGVWREPKVATSTKRDLLYLVTVLRSLRDTADPVAALAPLAVDPCSAQCAENLAPFDVQGRRAVAALTEAGHSLARVQRAARGRDAFASALSLQFADMQARLALVTLRPMPRLDSVADAGARALDVAHAPDLVLLVSSDGVRYGFVPHVQLSAAGEPVLSAPAPALPQTQELSLPQKMPAFYLMPLPQVVRRLKTELARDPDLSVAVALASGTEVDLLARVLISVRRVGREEVVLLGRGKAGATSGMTLSLVSKLEADQMTPGVLRLQVRPGSYSLRLGGALQRVEPTHDAEIQPFDLAALGSTLGARRFSTADVSFMLQMSADSLADALFCIGPAAGSTRLLLPPSALDESTEFKRLLLRRPKPGLADTSSTPPG
jgi:hypothetical protein